MPEKVTIPVKITMSKVLYDNFLQNIEDKGYVFAIYHEGLIKIEKGEE